MTIIGGATAVKILVEGVLTPWVAVLTLSLLAIGGGLLMFSKEVADHKAIIVPQGLFKTSNVFNLSAAAIVIALGLIYAILG